MFGTPNLNVTKKVEFGTAVQLSSANGNILAVGAPHHGYNSSTANPANLNDEGGAVFLYKFNGTDWNLLASFFGNPGEQIGDYLTLSASGSRIAIRRYNNTLKSINQVEVYDVAVTGTATKLGSGLSCGANGNSVSLSSSGSRVAVGCHTFSSNRGLVEIFDWNVGLANWASIGKVQMTENTTALFGWSVAFDDTGNRLAVSAPNYDRGDGILKRGLVRVYAFAGSNTWNQVGADIRGLTAGEQFGFSMDISGDGLSVVAGAPNSQVSGTTSFYGAVSVFGLDAGTSLWRPIGELVAGDNLLDRFGRSVSISRNGRRIAASSYFANAGRGVVKLFDFEGGQWATTGAITGTGNQDRFGFGLLSVTLTADGSRVASGSVWGNNTESIEVGRVRVYDDITAPSAVPSSSPSISAFVIAALTPTQLPTSPPTQVPTLNPTVIPSPIPTSLPTQGPTLTPIPIPIPTTLPTPGLTPAPTPIPTSLPTPIPTSLPSPRPSSAATSIPTSLATPGPTSSPAPYPTTYPTPRPTNLPIPSLDSPPTPGPSAPTPIPTSITIPRPTNLPILSPGSFTTQAPSPKPIVSGSPGPFAPTTSIPTIILSKFDWDLERNGDAVVSFGDSTNTNEITLNYNISNRFAVITIWDESCITPVSSSVIGVSSHTVIESSTHSNLQVSLDVKQDNVVGSALWRDGDGGIGFVNLCVRVDLVLDDNITTSVNFHEQKIFISIDLKQGFSVISVDLDRNAADQTNQNANVNYEILACQCTENFLCVNDILVQGSDVFICVYSNTANVHVVGISELTFRQGVLAVSPIVNFTEDAITAVAVSSQGARIRSQMRSVFFLNSNPEVVVSEGVAVLSFASQGNRLLRVFQLPRMLQQTESGSKDFNVTMVLKNNNIIASAESSGAARTSIGIAMIALAFGTGFIGFYA